MLFTPNVIKNLLKKPVTRKYPFEVRAPFPNYRGELVIDINKCIFCGLCSRKCPSQCITVDKPSGTWQCDPHACVYCGLCRDNCPTKCLSMKDTHRKPVTEKVTWIEHGNPPKPKKRTVEAKPEPALEAKPEAEVEAKPEAEVEAEPEVKVEAKTEATVETKVEVKPEVEAKATDEPKAEAKPETKAKAKPKTKKSGKKGKKGGK